MRRDHYSPPSKWTKEFRKALKLSHQHFVIYAYLEGGLESHRTGLYFVTTAAVAAMTIVPEDEVRSVMQDLERVGLIHWDEDADVVWVPCVCAEQFRWHQGTGAERDNRTIESRKHVGSLPDSHVVRLFLGVWPVFAEGASEGANQGAPYSTSPYSSSLRVQQLEQASDNGVPADDAGHVDRPGGKP
jgi:hypothetical protein